jgi:hypothetical protein
MWYKLTQQLQVHIDCCTLHAWWAKPHSIYNFVLNLYSLQYNWNTIYKTYSEYFQTNFRALATICIHFTHFISHLKQIQYTTSDNINDMAFCLVSSYNSATLHETSKLENTLAKVHSIHSTPEYISGMRLQNCWSIGVQKEVISVTTVSLCLNWLSYSMYIHWV